jgi:hypothetical protein
MALSGESDGPTAGNSKTVERLELTLAGAMRLRVSDARDGDFRLAQKQEHRSKSK